MRYFFIILFSFILSIGLNAQSIVNYTSSDGLLTDFVECIDVDLNGNVWIGTSIGLQKFDGSNWTEYNTINSPGLVGDNIKVITAMSNGDIWVGTDFGASRFDGISWTTYNNASGLNNNQVYSIEEDNMGTIWIGTHAGVSFYNGSIWHSYGYPDLHWSGVNGTAVDSDGNIWFSSPLGGVTCMVGNNFINYDTSNGLISQNATSIIIDHLNNKWIGTGGGVSVLDSTNTIVQNHTRMYIMPPPDTLNPVVDIALDYYQQPWIAIYVGYLAEGGVALWESNSETWYDYDVSDGLVGKNIKGIAIDLDNNVWIATTTGISKMSVGFNSINTINDNNILIYPNPSNGNLRISSLLENMQSLEIYNALSQLMYTRKITNNFIDINIDLDPGIYFIRINSKSGHFSRSLIIK